MWPGHLASCGLSPARAHCSLAARQPIRLSTSGGPLSDDRHRRIGLGRKRQGSARCDRGCGEKMRCPRQIALRTQHASRLKLSQRQRRRHLRVPLSADKGVAGPKGGDLKKRIVMYVKLLSALILGTSPRILVSQCLLYIGGFRPRRESRKPQLRTWPSAARKAKKRGPKPPQRSPLSAILTASPPATNM